MNPLRSCVTPNKISPAKVLASVHDRSAGCVVLFLGTVRNRSEGRTVIGLEYEAYREMAEKRLAELREISADAEARVLRYDWAGRVLGEYRDEVLAGKLTWEQKRKFVVALVKGIRVPKGGEPPGVTFGFPSDFARARDWARRGIVPAYTGPPAR